MNEQIIEILYMICAKLDTIASLLLCVLIAPVVKSLVQLVLEKIQEWRMLRKGSKVLEEGGEDEEL